MPATATLEHGLLTLSTGALTRRFHWNGGNLVTESLAAAGAIWRFPADRPDLALPGETADSAGGTFELVDVRSNAAWPVHRRADVTCRLGELEVRRVFRLYDGCPAIACDLYVRGRATGPWRSGQPVPYKLPGTGAIGKLADDRFAAPVVERIATGDRHLRVEIASFRDVTDLRNNLVRSETILPYRQPSPHEGNVLLAVDLLTDEGFFILKEAPCSDMQLAWPGCDFVCAQGDVVAVGLGLDADEVSADGWTRCYGFVTGAAEGGTLGLLRALRAYQDTRRVRQPGRDSMIMANTWGDRSQDARVSEPFALGEIEAGQRLGITHLQLDDGWQTGRSGMSVEGGSLDGIWDRGDWWAPRPERFPNGLAPVVEAGRDAGIEVCLWFNPSKDDSYAHWEDDAQTLIGLHREHGIRVFKIDGVNIPDKRADVQLRAMFDRVLEETGYAVTFNLDATAQRRFGYHYLNEYGTIFLENRYTDMGSYHPHWTLRNLWQLSRWVPAQNLQIEVLNVWRNRAKYPADDPLAPANVGWEYAFAATFAAQPLVWLEVQNLPAEAFELAGALRVYREHQPHIHAGYILPVGEEPCGVGWTGFQSLCDDGGYFLVYREHNDRPTARLAVWGLAGQRVACRAVLGAGETFAAQVDEDGRLEFALPRPFSYAVYEYRVER